MTDDERDATLDGIRSRGRSFVYQARLDQALQLALDETEAGDLILLLGAQGMDRGRELISSGGRS